MKSVFLLLFATTRNVVIAQPPPVNVTPMPYRDLEAFDLKGYMATPDNANGPLPAVVIVPDWDGVNLYEQQRATMLAKDMGYIGFAADIYGPDLHEVPDISQRIQLVNLYRGNATLFAQRIRGAVDFVKSLDTVDSDNVAIIGYCFGGTGVLMYALLGLNDVKALVSFHGGLVNLPVPAVPVQPKVLVLSGGDDDTSTDIMDLEDTLHAANATWEITRYSGIQHGFTVFSDRRYNARADRRSWRSAQGFLSQAFGKTQFMGNQPDMANVIGMNYTDVDGTALRGYLAKPNGSITTPLPAIIIVPDWDGVNQYEQERATLLASKGYIAFAADIYGADLQNVESFGMRIQLSTLYRSNRTLFIQRINRAIAVAQSMPEVDNDKIAVIGYCFGGTGAVDFAFSGMTMNAKVAVPFHGGLTNLPTTSGTDEIEPTVLVLSGGIDDAHGNQTELEMSLNAANATWEITRWSDVDHAFTVWGGSAYNLRADARSWEQMLTLFEDLIPLPVVATPTTPTTPPSSSGANSFVAFGSSMLAMTLAAALVCLLGM